jgi:ATP-grasp domain, R2K clade family 2
MIERVYVRKSGESFEFINPNVYSAWYGFQRLGIEAVPFTFQELSERRLPLARETAVIGGIQTVRLALEQLGCPPPENVDYPEPLRPFLGRAVSLTTMREAHRRCVDDRFEPSVFIKPARGHKDFDGHVLSTFRDTIRTARWLAQAPETPVWLSEVVTLVSEHRCFVSRRKIASLRHYKGDPLVFPEVDTVRRAVMAYTDAPAACTLDFGVLDSGKTVLVEVNDGFAFGAYGLDPLRHAVMLEDRWCEMVGLPLPVR